MCAHGGSKSGRGSCRGGTAAAERRVDSVRRILSQAQAVPRAQVRFVTALVFISDAPTAFENTSGVEISRLKRSTAVWSMGEAAGYLPCALVADECGPSLS